MTDAVSNIKLGIETGNGKADLVSLREEFTLLRQEVVALNSLKANAQGLVGGAQTAQAELATLGAELKSSVARVNELEQQLNKLNKTQASNAQATTAVVKNESKKQLDIQVGNLKAAEEAVAKSEEKNTKKVAEEAAKRASISASGTYGGVKYSIGERVSPDLAETNIIKAKLAEQARLNQAADAKRAAQEADAAAKHSSLLLESLAKDEAYITDLLAAHVEFQAKRAVIEMEGEAKHRALMFEGAMNDAKTEQERLEIAKAAAESRLRFEAEIQKKRDVLMASAGQKATLSENAEAYKQKLAEQNQEYQLYLQHQREYMARQNELEKTFAQDAKDKEAQVLKERNQQYQEYLLNQADHLKEWNDIEKLIAADEKEANRTKLLAEQQQYQEYQESIRAYRERQHDIEIAFQKAEEQEFKEHLMRQQEEAHKFNLQYNAERRATMLDARFDAAPLSTKVSITRNAASLVNRGETGLAHETYGSEAVGAVSKLTQMEAELNSTRKKGNDIVKEARASAVAYKDGLGDVHAAVKGLTHGFDQMWLSWGSMVPMVAGFAIAASMMKVLEVGKEVEFQLQYLKVTSNDLNSQPLDLNKFVNITETSMESLHDASTAIRVLAQSGLNAKDALIALPDVLNFATLGEMSATQAATSLSAVMHTFGKEASNFGNIGDVISVVANSTATTSTKMVDAMRQASTSGSMFHLSLEQVAASLGVMAEKGITGSQAGTALSTSLKNLYEPTEKASKALAKMGIDTTDGHGGLKDTVALIGDLREKMSTLNDDGQAKFLGTITDARAAKALAALIGNFGEYNKLLDKTKNAQDYMMQGTLQLEDTVEGGWRRMSNALEGSFMKAFTKAEPEIRSVQYQLAELAKSGGVVDFFTSLAVGAARVTGFLVENREVVKTLVEAYAAMRILTTITQGLMAYRLNVALATAATKAKTVATAGDTVATEANILTMETQAAMALAAGRSLTFTAMAARGLSFALGPVALGMMAAYTVYEIFTAKVSDSDLAMQKAGNTVNTTISYYQRQIEKLRELNEELRKTEKQGSETERATARTVLVAQLRDGMDDVKKAQTKVKKGPSFGDMMAAGAAADAGQSYETDDQKELKAAEAKVAAAQKGLEDLGKSGFEYKSLRKENQVLQDRRSILNELKQMKEAAGGGDDTEGAIRKLGTEKSRAMMPEIQNLMDDIENGKVALKDAAPKLKDLHDKLNEARGGFKPDVHDKAANDAYRAAQLKLDGNIQLHKDQEKSGLSDIKSKENTGEMGSLEAIVAKYEVIKKAREDDLQDFKDKENLAASQEHRRADGQSIENKRQANNRAAVEAQREMGREIAELQAKWNQDSLKSDADTFAKRGELVLAYEAQYKAAHQSEIGKLDKDINDSTLPQNYRDAASKRKGFLNTQYDAGHNAAGFDEDNGKAQQALAEMQERLQSVADKSARTNESARSPGFLSDLSAAQAADDIRNEAIPAIQSLIAEMGKLGNDPKSKSTIAKLSTDLVKEANRSRDAWIAAGKSIEKSLSDSFGKGGKAAGGLVSALIKQRETQKGIDDDLKRQKDDPKNADPLKQLELENKAREQSAQLQIGTYGDIAGAAKGFFDQHSKGYEAMQAAERVFRAFELAEAIRVEVAKSGLLTSFMSLFATAKTTEVAATAATVGPTLAAEGAKQGAFGITALAGALAAPFPENIPAFALVGAMLASIGIAVSGGGASTPPPDVAKERQKYAGTGYTYNSDDTSQNPYEWELQKSDSLAKSLEKLRDNSDIALSYSSSQLTQLESIKDGISGLANSIVQTTGIRGTKADENALGVGSSHSILGFSGSSTSLTDIGIKFGSTQSQPQMSEAMGRYFSSLGIKAPSNSQTIGSIMNSGVNATKYADTHSESKSFWGLSSSSSNDTTYSALDSDMLSQMNGVIKSMYGSVKDAAAYLGKSGTSVTSKLDSVTLQDAGLDKLSFKGMTNSEVEDQLNAAFSKLGDIMAKKAMPGLEGFSKATEGYLQTLVRVSTGVDQADYSLQKLGVTAVDYTAILNKQGDVATEIIRDSLVNKESTTTINAGTKISSIFGLMNAMVFKSTTVTTGIGEIIKGMTGSADDLTQAYTKLNDVRRTMTVAGMSNADVTTSMVKGAGGLDKLSSGVNDYLDKFFSEGEKAAAKVSLLQDEFARMGVTMPKSIQDFKTLVNGIDRTTDSGQTLYGALMSMAGEFGDVADSLGNVNPALAKQKAAVTDLIKVSERWIDLQKSARSMVTDIDAALSKTGKSDNSVRITELTNLMNAGTTSFEQQLELAGELKDLVLEKYQTEKANAQELIQYGKDLNKFVTSLKTGDLSPLTNKQKLEAAQADYATTLKNTQSDDKDIRDEARGDIQNKAQTYLDLAHTYYTSSQNYKDIFASVTGNLGNLGMSSIDQGNKTNDLNQEQVNELVKLRDLAKNIDSTATAEYNANAKQVEAQVTALQSVANSLGILSGLPEILAGMPAQLSASIGLGGTSGAGVNNTGSDQIAALYQSVLHRQADAGGLEFWKNAYNQGETIDQIKTDFMGSDEYKAKFLNGSHANGLDYVPFDGYVAELHQGESVLTAKEAQARRTNKAAMASTGSFSSAEREEMAAEIRELRKAVERVVDTSVQNTQALANAMHAATGNAAEHVAQATKDAASSSDYDNRNKPAYQ